MRSQDNIIRAVALLLGIVFLVGASFLSRPITKEREALQLTLPEESVSEMKPEYVIMSIVGGPVRNLMINWMWLRLNDFQRNQDLYQMQDIAKTITQLQPRHPRAWDYLAWNEAYNISVKRHTWDERWVWVRSGLDRLQKQGIPINPKATELYKQLAHYYSHKVWGNQDNAFETYRLRMAVDWQVILGKAPSGDRQAFAAWLDPMLEFDPTSEDWDYIGPKVSVKEIIDQIKEDTDNPAALQEQLKLMQQMGFNQNEEGYDSAKWILRIVAFAEARQEVSAALFPIKEDEKIYYELADQWLAEEDYNGSRERLIAGLRAAVVMGDQRMSPRRMKEVTELLGPLDWRHPLAHAVYWGHAGAVVSSKQARTEKLSFEAFNARAALNVAIEDLFDMGIVLFDLASAEGLSGRPKAQSRRDYKAKVSYMLQPDFAQTVIVAMDGLDESVYGAIGADYLEHNRFKTWKENKLRNLVTKLYLNGNDNLALRFYKQLQEEFPKSQMYRDAQYQMTMEEFVIGNIRSTIEFQDKAITYINLLLERSIFYRYMLGKGEQANKILNLSREIHGWVNSYQLKLQDGSDRLQLRPWDNYVLMMFVVIFQESRNMTDPEKVDLWAKLDLPIRQSIYDPLLPHFTNMCNRYGWDLNKAFPEPPGMERVRKLREEMMRGREQ